MLTEALESRLTAELAEKVVSSPEFDRMLEQAVSSPAVRAALARQTQSLGQRDRRRACAAAPSALDAAAERVAAPLAPQAAARGAARAGRHRARAGSRWRSTPLLVSADLPRASPRLFGLVALARRRARLGLGRRGAGRRSAG